MNHPVYSDVIQDAGTLFSYIQMGYKWKNCDKYFRIKQNAI